MKDNERGSVVVIFLALFLIIVLFLYAVYRLVNVDYQVVSKSFEDIESSIESTNLVELIKPYLAKDILGEPTKDELVDMSVIELNNLMESSTDSTEIEDFIIFVKDRAGVSSIDVNNLNDVINIITNNVVEEYVNDKPFVESEEIRDFYKKLRSIAYMKNFREKELQLFDIVYRKVEAGSWKEVDKDNPKWDFQNFSNYEEEFNEYEFGEVGGEYGVSRTYTVEDNWSDRTVTNDSVYQVSNDRGVLDLPDTVYLRIKFDPGVYRIAVELGNDFETATYEFVNRSYGVDNKEDLYILAEIGGNLPPTVERIVVKTEEDLLGNTEISILKGRELDVELTRVGLPHEDKVTVLRRTLDLDLRRGAYKIYTGEQESEVE